MIDITQKAQMIFQTQTSSHRFILFTFILFLGLLSACSNLPNKKQANMPEATSATGSSGSTTQYLPQHSAHNPTSAKIIGGVKKAPESKLDEDTLFQLLVAEIAGQRGDLDLSTSHYLELTRKFKDPALAERATRVMIYARRDKEALETAQRWVKYSPENLEAQQILAAMYIRNNMPDEAQKQLEEMLAKAPEKTEATMQMLATFINRPEDKGTAFKVMEHLMAGRQNDPKAMFAYGILTLRSGDIPKSREIMEKVIKLEPDDQNYQLVYLNILEKDGDNNAAFQYIEELLKKKPDDFGLLLGHARIQADLGRYDLALEEFRALTISHPDNTDAHYALGLLSLQTNHTKEAKKQFKTLIKKQVLVNESSYYLGQVAEFEKDFEEAISWYEAIDNGSPNYFDAQIKIAIATARLGKLKESRANLAQIVPQNHKQKLQLVQVEAEILVEEGKYTEAKDIYDKAILKERHPDLLYSRAMLSEKMNRLDLLEQDLKEIIEKDPDNADVLNALGYSLADRTDRYQEAHDYIKKALEISPDNFYILDSMGWVLYRLGRLDESIQYLKRAKALNDDPEVSAHLSEVLWVKGNKKEAKEILNSALKAKPEDKRLLEALKRLKP